MTAKPYIQRQPAGWWLKSSAYRRYMLREATALPIFLYCLLLISGLYQLTQGEAAFLDWLQVLRSPWVIALHVVAFAAALFHAWTWIELVPKILVVHTSRFTLSPQLIKRVHQGGALACFVGLIGLAVLLLTRATTGAG